MATLQVCMQMRKLCLFFSYGKNGSLVRRLSQEVPSCARERITWSTGALRLSLVDCNSDLTAAHSQEKLEGILHQQNEGMDAFKHAQDVSDASGRQRSAS